MKCSKPFKVIGHYFCKRILFFGRNSGVHGLRHVFSNGANIFTRLFWLSMLLASAGFLYLLLIPVARRAEDITVTPDTLYLDWNTTFPAVTICESYDSKMALRKLTQLYRNLTEPLNIGYQRYITDLIYGVGACSRSTCMPCGDKIPCDVPWSKIVHDVHLKCFELLSSSTCYLNSENFPCCKEFLRVDSEYGPCYSFNSLQRKNVLQSTLFTVNRTTGPGVLSFCVRSNAQISIHSTEELSTKVLNAKFKFDVKTQEHRQVDIWFSVIEVDNEPLVRLADIDVRKCRYAEEVPQMPLHTYPAYSYTACRLAMNTKESFQYCGCIHPARDISYRYKYCNFTGLNCLVNYNNEHKIKLGTGTIMNSEDCLPACEESELSIVHSRITSRGSDHINNGEQETLVNIRMISLPTMRYKKAVLRTHLDFVVSVGGMVGLFFSASIISLAEIFYLIFRSP